MQSRSPEPLAARSPGARPRHSRAFQIGRGLVAVLGLLVALGLVGAVYESVAESADARTTSPTGQMIDVGGYSLYINCVGTGTPTVVIDAGWGDSSAAWSSSVQPAAAGTTRVCTYDRAGVGFSEAGPLPRTAEQFARELHALLRGAGVPGPYVLVGHSMGGLTIRVYAREYASEVAAVVLIDSMSPSSARPSDPAVPTDQDSHSIVDWVLTLPSRTGVLRLVSAPVRGGEAAFYLTPRSLQAWLDEGKGMPASLAQAGAVDDFGALPLIVLSRGLVAGQDQEWQRMQTELLDLSSSSQQLFAEKSGHNVELDQPEAAVGAIEMMVEQIREQASAAAR